MVAVGYNLCLFHAGTHQNMSGSGRSRGPGEPGISSCPGWRNDGRAGQWLARHPLHEAVGHGLRVTSTEKAPACFLAEWASKVAAKGVTVLDDGTLPDRRGSLNVDDEGHATQRTVLIEDGILRGYMQDATNARLMKVAPTGNGAAKVTPTCPCPA